MEFQQATTSNTLEKSNEIQKQENNEDTNLIQPTELVSTVENNVNIKTDTNNEVQRPIRNDLVKVAVQFLQNPKVQTTSLEQRKKFLKTKGLTNLEIDEALRRSHTPTIDVRPPIPPALNSGYVPQLVVQQPSLLTRVKDGLQSVALISALMYGLYVFYKRYIYPLLFNKPKRKTIQEEVEDLTKEVKTSTEEIRSTVIQIQNDLTTYNERRNSNSFLSRQIDDLKAEISTVKSLLLSKKQFPTVSNSPVVPPSIPAWQLSNVEHAEAVPENDEAERDKSDGDKSEEIMELGSGSGSSETEVVLKNSDSSIEIM